MGRFQSIATPPSVTPRPTVDVSVVVPVLNEQGSLRALDAEIRRALARTGQLCEIIYVDDGSSDGSGSLLNHLAEASQAGLYRTRVVKFRRNFGQTAALAAGFALAEGTAVIPLDADGQNNPADIPRLLAEFEKGFDCVSGWRRSRQDKGLTRRLPSQLANWLVARVSGVNLHDTGCTLKAYRGSLLKELDLYGDMHRFLPLYLAQLGARVTEVVVDHRPRTTGTSKYGVDRVFKVVWDLFLIRFMSRYSTRPMQFFGRGALAFFGSAAASVATMLGLRFGWLSFLRSIDRPALLDTPLPIVAAVFALGGALAIFCGILAEVLIRIQHATQHVKPYRIESIVDSAQTAPGTPAQLRMWIHDADGQFRQAG